VAFDAGKPSLLRPSSVAVHDDGYVPGKLHEIEPVDELVFFRAGLDIPFQAFKHKGSLYVTLSGLSSLSSSSEIDNCGLMG